MNYLNKQIKDLLNDKLHLLSYSLASDLDANTQQIQLINDGMRLIINFDTKTKQAEIAFLTGEELDTEEFFCKKEVDY